MKRIEHFNLTSLGCPKNRVDSEKILHTMLAAGYEHTQDQEKAQIIIINTCSFIQPAVEESISSILDSASVNPNAFLIVAGCLPLRYGQSLDDSLPEVDLFIAPNQIDQVAELIESSDAKKKFCQAEKIGPFRGFAFGNGHKAVYEFKRVLSTPGYAYLRISDGCDHLCKFCSIPLIRGKLKSETIDDILLEAKELTDLGIREIILIAQDLTSYGRDLGLKNGLVQLLEKLEKVSGVDWLRLMYLYPSGINDDLIDLIRDSQKILPYLDVPIQHISDNVLQSMGRPWRGAQIKKLIDSMRSKIPNIVIRTTVMVGFPSETESDFEELKNFINEFELDHVGVFTYFREEGTSAEKLGDPIPKKVKNARARALRSLHSVFIKKKNKKRIGKTEAAIIEGFSEETELLLQGRIWDQAPEIDGKLYITAGNVAVGDIKNVLITKAHGVDLFGEVQE
ncbi:MAG: 30S ribosomal protein S12 methylthiotransferase RimO [Deltaproteobacteria bacterium]|nr:30S ribosomal protein S12 methylthiotransferase RimO [Deltaproteobacteria bacterium]